MIAELLLIVDLLNRRKRSTPTISQPDIIQQLKPQEPTPIRPPSGYTIDLNKFRYLKDL
jgi:hypothetical protein